MLKRALEEQKNAKSQHVGPGHYDPKPNATMKRSPSLSFTKHGLTGPALAEGLADMADLVTGRGNMAERVTAARERIHEYLGSGPGMGRNKALADQASRQKLELAKEGPKGYFDGYSRSVTNKHASKINLSGAAGMGGSTITQGPAGGVLSSPNAAALQPSPSFLSGVKRTDFAK